MSHAGIRGGKGSGRRGRPSRAELAAFDKAVAARATWAELVARGDHRTLELDALEAIGLCDCGEPLDGHPPLRQPGPLRSWKARKEDDPTKHPSIWTNSR
jgi:hypothetical protein